MVTPSADREQRFNRVLADYLEAAEVGSAPDPAAWLASHPDLADELASFLTAIEQVDRFAGPFRHFAAFAPVGGVARPFGEYELLVEIGRGAMGTV